MPDATIHWRLTDGHAGSDAVHPIVALSVMRRMMRKYPAVAFWLTWPA